MKQLLSVAALAAVMLAGTAGTASARSWRVNSNAAKAPHFTTINAACSSEDVQAGDTLYLDPDMYITSDQTISKTLTVIGTGYFLTNLPYGSATIAGGLTISAANSKIEGCVITGIISVKAQNVTIERCKADNSNITIGMDWLNGSNAVFRQCYLKRIFGVSSTDNKSAHCTIENCMFVRSTDNAISSLYYPIIRNNSILFDYNNSGCNPFSDIANAQIYNNVIIRKDSYPNQLFFRVENSEVYNNVLSCSESTYPAWPQNRCLNSKDASLVWTLTGANEAQYQLKDESPAEGYAAGGGDCGAFGGLFPYVLSGHPVGMPYFESTNTPTRSINGQVKITQHVKLQTN